MLLLRKKNAGKTGASAEHTSGHMTHVTSGQKAPLGRILHNFRLRMCRTYFRTEHVTESLPVTSLPVAPHSTSANVTLSVRYYPYTTYAQWRIQQKTMITICCSILTYESFGVGGQSIFRESQTLYRSP